MTRVSVSHMWVCVRLNNIGLRKKRKKKDEQGREGRRRSGKKKGEAEGQRGGSLYRTRLGNGARNSVVPRHAAVLRAGPGGHFLPLPPESEKRGGVRVCT